MKFMCGRFNRFETIQQIATRFGAKPSGELLAPPNYNAAPQDLHPVIRLDPDGEREIVEMRWGLVHRDTKDIRLSRRPINAKAEAILETWPFKDAVRFRRCLVPVNGFYEWRVIKKGVKHAYAIGMRDKSPFALAGLWESWIAPDQTNIETFTVVTCDPNEVVEMLHNRMPVIIPEKDYNRWLEPGNPRQPPVDLLRPYPAELMRAWRIGPDVGNVENNRPDLLDEIPDEEDDDPQGGLPWDR